MIYCQQIAIWGVDGHTMSYVFMCSLVNSSGIYYLRLNWEGILCMLKILIIVSCVSFQQLEALKYDLNILLVNFFLQCFWNRWHLSDTQGQNLLTLEVCVFLFVCVCICWIEWGRECICVCVCVCVCALTHACAALVISTRYFFIFYFKTIAIKQILYAKL